ncbi:hypothetical protein T07_8529 [Trichinella nelsoni]|uniref:Uncharacterized protein n=1 Tax=Trichinella nelsoni TaxID=6336 RepID=A0A0V0S269_9BILA|nr:hypothetical protein T07_8529 [Trichinella nelsoni]
MATLTRQPDTRPITNCDPSRANRAPELAVHPLPWLARKNRKVLQQKRESSKYITENKDFDFEKHDQIVE